ncbi:hypothetical protein IQ07DRAFT_583522 [Pyrenochaeta sp. DS3sAY3a]|nr:hypothetical protein IQ07DRAFT_583522 [Pyrenochaeta sp. DS3sAY3a]
MQIDKWLDTCGTSGVYSQVPSPEIPEEYLQKPRRQHPASQRPRSSSSFSTTRSPNTKRKHTLFEETESPGISVVRKRRRVPNANMSRTSGSPSRKSDRLQELRSTVVLDKTIIPPLTPSASVREDMDSLASSVIASSHSQPRSRSPTKRMVDLRVAEKRVVFKTAKSPIDVPDDVRKLYKSIQSLARVPRGVVPRGIEDELIQDADGELEDLDILVATESSGMTPEQLLDEFKVLRKIRDSTAFCKTNSVHEPAWNERVHCRILEQAVCNRPGMEYHNVTTARVTKELVPGNKYGELLKNKMIDYAIVLRPPLVSEAEVINRLATSPRPLQRSINPSDYSPLCHSPIAISIETKSPEGGKENGEVQLSVWAMAYFNRLRALTQDPVSITLPLILISGAQWKLMFARDSESSIEIFDAVAFAHTEEIIGCYTTLSVLRLLCEWAEETFLSWFSDRVLNPE